VTNTQTSPIKSLTLHIGFPKTGTTALQDYLSFNYEALLEQGAIYPKAGRYYLVDGEYAGGPLVFHHPLANSFSKNQQASILSDIHNEATSAGASEIILSSELFFCIDPGRVISSIRQIFGPSLSLNVVAYIREPVYWLMTLYCQQVKGELLFSDFTPYFIDSENLLLNTLSCWINTYPQIKLRYFSKGCLIDSDIIVDFFALHKIDIDIKNLSNPVIDRPPSRENLSIGGNLLEAKRVCNTLISCGSAQPKNYHMIFQKLSKLDRFSYRLPFIDPSLKSFLIGRTKPTLDYLYSLSSPIGNLPSRGSLISAIESLPTQTFSSQKFIEDVSYLMEEPQFEALRPFFL
jgi:hypothetical protein